MTPDPGFGVYDAWSGSGMSIGQVLLPHQGGVTRNGQFDVVIHFHGHEPIRKEFVKSAKGIVLVGIDQRAAKHLGGACDIANLVFNVGRGYRGVFLAARQRADRTRNGCERAYGPPHHQQRGNAHGNNASRGQLFRRPQRQRHR